MSAGDGRRKAVVRDLQIALGLAVFMELGFIVALLALAGAFSGGSPTTTPFMAQAYLVVGFVLTIAVIVRTARMLRVAQRSDVGALQGMHIRLWAAIAFVFSAILPSIYLNVAANALNGRR